MTSIEIDHNVVALFKNNNVTILNININLADNEKVPLITINGDVRNFSANNSVELLVNGDVGTIQMDEGVVRCRDIKGFVRCKLGQIISNTDSAVEEE